MNDPKSASSRPSNRLAKEISPYLLGHKHNPVDWFPWGKEAFEKARKENKPIFLSIGYSACHWCHVMERESFENEEIAAVMNKLFVCVKVDREERPDLDDIYMNFLQSATGGGGWPMSVWLTPDLMPFYGGTYYPPKDSPRGRGFKTLCERIGTAWRDNGAEIRRDGLAMAKQMQASMAPQLEPGDVDRNTIQAFGAKSLLGYDAQHHGFGRPPAYAPKFPHASELAMLLRHHVRQKDGQALEAVQRTLQAMANGGIYDQLGGGFHRYSVDREWRVPHFEKMLYDNAQLAVVYAEAWSVTQQPLFLTVVCETLDYLLAEMQDPDGGIYSTQDADSEGVEGKFFVWTKAELQQVLGDELAGLAAKHYGVTDQGNWAEMPGKTVLQRSTAADVDAKRLEQARQLLLAARSKRPRPATDDKVLAAWNGLALRAFAAGYQVTGQARYLQAGQRVADFLLRHMRRDDGRLFRVWRRGEKRLAAYLDDHAFVAAGLLHLFECDFDPRWLSAAKEMLEIIARHHLAKDDGSFYFCANDHEALIAHNKSVFESSEPSGIAVAILAFYRAGLLLGEPRYLEIAERALRANKAYLVNSPAACSTLVMAADQMRCNAKEVVIVGPANDAQVQAFLRKARRAQPMDFVLTHLHDGNREALAKLSPLYRGKTAINGKATAYVCTLGTCQAPITDPDKLSLHE